MCCESKAHHSGDCACGCHSRLGPAFWTDEEKIAWLEKHLESLREQADAVQERITALKGPK